MTDTSTHQMQTIEAAARLQMDQGDIDGALARISDLLTKFPHSPGAFLAYKAYRLRKDLASAKSMTDRIAASGRVTWRHIAELAVVAGACGDIDEAARLLDYALKMPNASVSFLIETYRRVGLEPPSHTVPTPRLVPAPSASHRRGHELSVSGDDDAVLAALSEALETGIEPRVVHHAMRQLSRERRPELVQAMLDATLAHGLAGTEYAIEAAMRAWSTTGHADRVESLLREAQELQVVNSYHFLASADAWARIDSYGAVARTLVEMVDSGLAPPATSELRAVARLVANADATTAKETLAALRDGGVALSDAVTYAVRHRFGSELSSDLTGGSHSETSSSSASLPRIHYLRDMACAGDVDGVLGELQREASKLSARDQSVLLLHVLQSLCRAGRNGDAMSLMGRMSALGIPPDAHHYAVVMMGWAMAADPERVHQLVGNMMEQGIELSSHHFSALVIALSRAGYPRAAEHELDTFVAAGGSPHPRHHFGPILSAYRRLGRPAEAARVMESMFELGVEPDRHNVSDLMQAYANEGLGSRSVEVFERFVAAGGKPDAYHYATLMQIAANEGDAPRCEQLAAEMLRSDIPLAAVHFSNLIKANARSGDIVRARELFEQMQSTGVDPDSFTYGTLAYAYASAQDAVALDELTSLIVDRELLADPHLLAGLVRAWAAVGDSARGTALLDKLPPPESGDARQTTALLHLIGAFANAGDTDSVVHYTRLLSEDEYALPGEARAALVIAASRNADVTRTADLFDRLVSPEFDLPPHQLALVLGGLAAIGLTGRAHACARELHDRAALQPRSVGQLLDALTRSGEPIAAEGVLREFVPSLELLPEEETYLYNLLLRAFHWAGSADDVERIKEEMLSRGLQLDRFSLGAIEGSRRRAGVLDDASLHLRSETAYEWQELTVLLDDVVHELSQWVGQLGSIINATRRLDPSVEPGLVTERLNLLGGVVHTLAGRLDEYAAVAQGAGQSEGHADIADSIEWAIRRTDAEAHRHGVAVHVDVATPTGDAGLEVNGSEFYVRLAIKALVANGIDALASSEVPPHERRIWVNALTTPRAGGGRWIDLFIRDNGPGIPDTERDRVFERGYSTKKGRGLGLGLSLVDGVAGSLGGTVSVTRNGVGGAEFWLRLPQASPTSDRRAFNREDQDADRNLG